MRIALIILHADPARGGAERYTIDLAEALRRRGNDVTLLALSFAAQVKRPEDVLLEGHGATRAGRYVSFLNQLDHHFETNPYDIVHAMFPVRECDIYHPHAGIAAEAVASGHLKYDCPVKRTLSRAANRFNRRRQRFAAVERELLMSDRPPIVLCLSQFIKDTVRKHYPLPEKNLATLFNAVDLAKFDPSARPRSGEEVKLRFNISGDEVVALMIAQDFARKGLREAVIAVGRFADPKLNLLVVGKEDPEPYRRVALRAGVQDRVVFAGSTDDPYSFYRAADFFVLPTRHDPCSLVVLEALAMGLPVVSTAFNGACEIMSNGEHGFVLQDPADVTALEEAMRKLLDPVARKAMAQACLRLRPRLSFDRHVDDLIQIYEHVRVSSPPRG